VKFFEEDLREEITYLKFPNSASNTQEKMNSAEISKFRDNQEK